MKRVIIEGKEIVLEQVFPEDVTQEYLKWMNDKQTTQYLESRFYKTDIKRLKEYVRNCLKDSLLMAIVVKKEKRHIGNIKIGPINKNHGLGDIGILIGEKNYWGKGYGTEAIKLLCKHAFTKLKLHKVTASCYEPNIGSKNAFMKLGFRIEGFMRKHYICNGKYVDAYIFGLLKEDFKEKPVFQIK